MASFKVLTLYIYATLYIFIACCIEKLYLVRKSIHKHEITGTNLSFNIKIQNNFLWMKQILVYGVSKLQYGAQ